MVTNNQKHPGTRSLAVDFYRGLALVVIMLDHIPGSLLSHITLHNYAFCDAAEVFVCLGGYSTAAAYMKIDAKQGATAAGRRFYKRSFEIYRAFLVLAALMLVIGMTLHGLHMDTPEVNATEATTFLQRPFGMLLDVASLRRQPFLSSVLPMYAIFALCAPFMIRCACKAPLWTALGSVAMWLLAPTLAQNLPSAYPEGWAFNPFAWQIIFVIGVMIRLYPVSTAVYDTPLGKTLTRAALLAFVGFACWQLLTTTLSPGYEKQNVALLRLLNFAALLWVGSWISARGWIDKLAERLPAVVLAGKHSLVCFMAGACVSISIDGISRLMVHPTPKLPSPTAWMVGAADDISAIVILLTIVWIAANYKARNAAASSAARGGGGSGVAVAVSKTGRRG